MEYIGAIVAVVVFGSVLVDLIGSIRFMRGYFRTGVPLYRRRFPVSSLTLPDGVEHYLTRQMRSSVVRNLVFARLSDSELGFREKVFEWGFKLTFTPVMHGHIEFAAVERTIVITGRANWSVLSLFAIFAVGVWGGPPGNAVFMLAFFIGILLLCYFAQVSRFRAVAKHLTRLLATGT